MTEPNDSARDAEANTSTTAPGLSRPGQHPPNRTDASPRGSAARRASRTIRRRLSFRNLRPSWMPALALSSALGVLIYAWAADRAWAADSLSYLLYWLAVAMIFVPAAVALFSRRPRRTERLGAVMILAGALYLLKVLHSPLWFTFPDEFTHWRTLQDMLLSGTLHGANPLLVISPDYPGVEGLTMALIDLAGLPVFEAALLVIGIARLVMALALFVLFEALAGSARAAGLGTLVYMANPSFLFFDAQFSYESLALPLAVAAIFCVVRWQRTVPARRPAYAVLAALLIAAVAMTHHVSSLALLALLSAWALAPAVARRLFRGRRDDVWLSSRVPAAAFGLAALVNAGWVALFATDLPMYLANILGPAVREFVGLLTGQVQGRTPFAAPEIARTPAWEVAIGYASVIALLIALLLAGRLAWRAHRGDGLVLVFLCAALLYPVTLGLRLTSAGAETAVRSSEFLFVAIGFLVGSWLARHPLPADALAARRLPRLDVLSRRPRTVATAFLTLVFAGGIILGLSPINRLPGPHLVGADQRSIDLQLIRAAEWMRLTHGADNRLVADRMNQKVMATYGRQYPVTAFNSGVGTAWVVFSSQLGRREQELLSEGRVDYIVIDRRLSTAVPITGTYFEAAEPNAGRHEWPIPLPALEKFDGLRTVNRLYDGGQIVIYDVRRFVRVGP